jgi:hypothetical protein
MRGLTVLGGVSSFVKAGWVLWFVWCAGLILWYRLGRIERGQGRSSRQADSRSTFGLGLSSGKFESSEVAKASSRKSGRRPSVVDDPNPIPVLR